MIQTCTQCGAINEAQARTCCFCEATLVPEDVLPGGTSVSSGDDSILRDSETDWRHEVAHRLAAYRARRRRWYGNPSQAPLPFDEEEPAAEREADGAYTSFVRPADVSSALPPDLEPERPERLESVEIDLTPPASPEVHDDPRPQWAGGNANEAALLPVAAVGDRLRAGMLDALFLLLAYGGFLVLFGSLGGQFSFGKFDAVVYIANLYLVYAQYFALFTVLGGATPGMWLRRVTVVSFDGSAPTPRQLLWRSFGYLVSGGTLMLGFLWALWDEDRLTWQDRISQTYLTRAQRVKQSEPLDPVPGSPGIAPK